MGSRHTYALRVLIWICSVLLATHASAAERSYVQCDPAIAVEGAERSHLLEKLSSSSTGKMILSDFEKKYGSLERLLIQWDSVSYSRITNSSAGRGVASTSDAPPSLVCVHLSHKLPDIEHVADLAHELTHATRLSLRVLRGDIDSVDEFVHARLSASGGEADAFAVECQVKREILGQWDTLCSPYVKRNQASEKFDLEQVLADFYSGKLSASLTGESYPKMLGRQFGAILEKRAIKREQIKYSALENKSSVH